MSKANPIKTNTVKRADVLQSSNQNSSKGKSNDIMLQQMAVQNNLTLGQIQLFYESGNGIYQNIIDVPAEDATRLMPEIIFDDDIKTKELYSELIEKLDSLEIQKAFQEQYKHERNFGNGYIIPILLESGGGNVEKELKLDNIVDVLSLNVLSRLNSKINVPEVGVDPLLSTYQKPLYYNIGFKKVHPSRVMDLRTTKIEDDAYGIPMLKKIYDTIINLDSITWSVGQIVYSFVFKVLKSDEASFRDNESRTDFEQKLEKEFNTKTLAVIGKEDELTFISPTNAMNNLKDIFTFIWDIISGAAKMPKSHILGQPQGTITGGQYDTINYYAKISQFQKNFFTPQYRRIIDMCLVSIAKKLQIQNFKLSDYKYKLKYQPLWELNAKEQAEVDKIEAEIYDIYIKNGTLTNNEVREEKFNKTDKIENPLLMKNTTNNINNKGGETNNVDKQV